MISVGLMTNQIIGKERRVLPPYGGKEALSSNAFAVSTGQCGRLGGLMIRLCQEFLGEKARGGIFMIELAFGESAAGALKLAKTMKQGDRLNGAIAMC